MRQGKVGASAEECYADGLERVAKVIESATDYDFILGPGRLGKPQYDAIIAEHGRGKLDAAASIMSGMVRASRLVTYRIPGSARILSYGKTHNNRVQLDYFERKTRPWRSSAIVELSTCDVDRTPRIATGFGNSLESRLKDFLARRRRVSKSVIHQLVGYSASYCSFLASLSASAARGLVVANDHSPVPVAASMAARARGLTRVYLQHAQVTKSFPPLDFEYSILMNRSSQRIYEQIAGTGAHQAGEVVVARRQSEQEVADPVFQRIEALSASDGVAVGIYPSAVYDLQRLEDLVKGLKANRAIASLFLKPHPSMDLSDVALTLGVSLRSQVPAEAHVAIVGNSSVTQELATAGNLVFQDFGLDQIAKDYYGFVGAGLAAEFQFGEVGNPFWRCRASCERLRKALSDYFEEAAQGLGEVEEQHFFKKVSVAIGGGLSPGMGSAAQLNMLLRLFPGTFLEAMRSKGGAIASDIALVAELDGLFNERILDLNGLYPHVDPARCRSIADFWIITKLVQWSGTPLSDRELHACKHFISTYEGDPKAKRWMESKYFDMLLQLGKTDMLPEFLDSARHFKVKAAHLNKKIAFLKICNQAAPASPGLEKHYDYGSDELGDLERLKIEVQCMLSEGGKLLFDDYRAVESRFLEAAPPAIANEYARVVRPIYERLRGRDRFIDVKRNNEQAAALVALVAHCLRDRRGFAAVRLSDGEGYLFRKSSPYFTESDARNRERHWWGEELGEELRELVVGHGLRTVAQADVIGIPSIYRFLRDCSPNSKSLLASIQGRGLASVLHGVLDHAPGTALFSDDKFNIAVFNQRPYLEEIASSAARTIVVTGARADVVREALSYLGKVDVINVPTHNKTSANDRFYTADKPLPYLLEAIRAQVEAESAPGVLVLVGAGIAGKSFVHAAKAAGGVGLDLGSALDELVDAGIHSLH